MTKIFCMAAGKGTRLRPWTGVVPKPALPLANEPALGYLMRHVARNGYRDVVTNSSYLSDVLMSIMGDGTSFGVNLDWSIEDQPLGTAGGVLHAQDRLRDGDEPVFVLSGDGIHDVDLAGLERTHRETGAIVTMALQPVADASQYGVAVLDSDGCVTGFQEKPARGTELSKLANTGIYVLAPEALDLCASWGFTDFGEELLPKLVAEGKRVQGVSIGDTYWNDIGNVDEFRASNFAIVQGLVASAGHAMDDEASPYGEDILVHPTADVDSSATLIGPCVIGANAHVGAGAQLRSAVVMPGGIVAPGEIVASGTVGTFDGLSAWAQSLAH